MKLRNKLIMRPIDSGFSNRTMLGVALALRKRRRRHRLSLRPRSAYGHVARNDGRRTAYGDTGGAGGRGCSLDGQISAESRATTRRGASPSRAGRTYSGPNGTARSILPQQSRAAVTLMAASADCRGTPCSALSRGRGTLLL